LSRAPEVKDSDPAPTGRYLLQGDIVVWDQPVRFEEHRIKQFHRGAFTRALAEARGSTIALLVNHDFDDCIARLDPGLELFEGYTGLRLSSVLEGAVGDRIYHLWNQHRISGFSVNCFLGGREVDGIVLEANGLAEVSLTVLPRQPACAATASTVTLTRLD
jgi:HK97 family phage prohead protease